MFSLFLLFPLRFKKSTKLTDEFESKSATPRKLAFKPKRDSLVRFADNLEYEFHEAVSPSSRRCLDHGSYT